MRYLDCTLPTAEENLACDEALLDLCEDGFEEELLRFWEPKEHFVVLGYSNRVDMDVHLAACQELNIPVLRRCSGGGTVLQGPGCLNVSLILKIGDSSPFGSFSQTTFLINARHKQALEPLLGVPVTLQGFSDLALGSLKFSGSAQRYKRRHVLFHGTFLLALDIPLVERLLWLPARQPRYRHNRSHTDFLKNLQIPAALVKETIRATWGATVPLEAVPLDRIQHLVKTRYATFEWTMRC